MRLMHQLATVLLNVINGIFFCHLYLHVLCAVSDGTEPSLHDLKQQLLALESRMSAVSFDAHDDDDSDWENDLERQLAQHEMMQSGAALHTTHANFQQLSAPSFSLSHSIAASRYQNEPS